MHPGSCCVCGSGNCDDGYLDLGVYYDYEGTMYLCMTCAYQAGETVGLYTPDEVKLTQQQLSDAMTQIAALTEELEYARPIVAAVESVSERFASADSVSSSTAGTDEYQVYSATSESSEGPADGESVTEEPVEKPRSSDSRGLKLFDITP